MLTPKRTTTLMLLTGTTALIVGSLFWLTVQRVGPPSRPNTTPPSNVLAEASGIAITYDPNYSGLTLKTSPRTARTTTGIPSPYREVVRLEPRALVGGSWLPAAAPPERLSRPRVIEEADTIIVQLDEMVLGDVLTTSWRVSLSRSQPTVTIERLDHFIYPRDVTSSALVAIGAPNRSDERLVLVSGTAYTLPERSIVRVGSQGYSGIINRDLSLSFTLDTHDATRITGERVADRDQIMLMVDRPANSPSTTVQSTTRFQLGPRVPLQRASSTFNPNLEAFLLTAGYYGNVFISERNGRVLTASMKLYPDSVWIRDVASASRGYLYVLGDDRAIESFRNTLVQFLERTRPDGVVPEYFNEAGKSENREAWDAMPDLIHGIYAYVSRTGDLNLVRERVGTMRQVVGWIRRLDSDDDGLPDRDIYPYGYFDSVENGVMHTYAIASFYAALHEMADMVEAIGESGQEYRDYAARMRTAYNRPLSEGGYWQTQLGYPIAWKKSDGRVVTGFETFGVLTAVRVGLIHDPARLATIGELLRSRRAEFVNQNGYPTRLMLGGYDQAWRRPGVHEDNRWMLDANAPWLTGHDVWVRARLGDVSGAEAMLTLYQATAGRHPPMPEFGAAAAARYGSGDSRDGGRLWDNSAWFDAIYGTHYGLVMTPSMLHIQPNPLRRIASDAADNLDYQKMRFRLTLTSDGYTLTVDETAQPRPVTFYPVGTHKSITVNDGAPDKSITIVVQPGTTYRVRSNSG